jgi:biotin carboxylase
MKKKILIVGGGHSEVPLVTAAKELGLYVITTGNQVDGIAHNYSDEFHICDYSNNEDIYQLAKKLDIDYICFGAHDLSYFSTIYTASKLGLDFFDDINTAQILHHKDKFKVFCKNNNICSPKAESFSDKKTAIDYVYNITLPCIVKPVDMGGGKGISKITNTKDIENAIENAFNYSKSKTIVVEDFFEGTLHSISMFIINKSIKFYFEDTEIPCQNNPYGVCTSISPSENFIDIKDNLLAEIKKIINLLDLKDGLFHTQYLKNENKFKIVECTRRLPGDFYNIPVELATGFEYAKNIIKVAIGKSISDKYHTQNKYLSRHCIVGDGKVIYNKNIKENIVDIFVLEYTKSINKQAIVFLEYHNFQEMKEKTKQLNQLIEIKK